MKKLIRNSTAEFLIFTSQAGEDSIEVRVEDETVWLTQKLISELFGVDVRTVSEHLQNIFKNGELQEESVIRKFRNTASDGKNYLTQFYNLDAIISVGYRVNSKRATQFRQWATQVLREFAIKGYVLDNKRLENGAFLGEDYFENLLAEIREIRLSERRFYQKITDIYATSLDYSKDTESTKNFFGMTPQLAERTGFNEGDANKIKEVLPKLFEGDASSARPEGSMVVEKVIWWKHNCKSGQYSSAKVHRTLTVKGDGSYTLANLDGLEPEEIDGF